MGLYVAGSLVPSCHSLFPLLCCKICRLFMQVSPGGSSRVNLSGSTQLFNGLTLPDCLSGINTWLSALNTLYTVTWKYASIKLLGCR